MTEEKVLVSSLLTTHAISWQTVMAK